MATGPGFPSATNVYAPNLEASGRLITGYSRNVKKFNLPKYVQYVQTKQMVGLYMRLSAQEAARVVTTQDFEWADGTPRPMHADGLEQFNMVEFRTHRYDYGYSVGWLTEKQADWPIMEQHSQIKAAQCMTARTVRMLTAATLSTNWTTAASGDYDLSQDHTATAASWVGGFLDQGTSTAPYIKIFLDKTMALINMETIGVVDQDSVAVIINPNQARLWAESSEIHEFIKGSYWAQEELTKGLSPNNKFGLPSSLYGYTIIVENTVRVTSRKGATLAKSLAMPDQKVLFVSRVGGLEGVYGSPSFSTLTLMYFGDEMGIQAFGDDENQLSHGHVVENTAELVTSPLSGYLLTSSTSKAS